MKFRSLLVAGFGVMALASAAVAAEQSYEIGYVGADGIALPDYGKWVFLSSGLGMSYAEPQAGNPAFTNVFAEPGAYDQFMRTGVWPDKTVLVLEARASVTDLSINKHGWAQTGPVLAVEIEVKDAAKNGWTFYNVPAGETAGKAFPRSFDCYACHAEHAAVDNTFVQFYPSLIDVAKSHGTFKEETK